jgi:hypothetical protein
MPERSKRRPLVQPDPLGKLSVAVHPGVWLEFLGWLADQRELRRMFQLEDERK